AEDAEAAGVDLGPRREPIDDGAREALEVAADRRLEPHLALPRAVEGEGGDPAGEAHVLEEIALLLRALEPADQDRTRRAPDAGRPAEPARDREALEGDLDALGRRHEERRPPPVERHLPPLARLAERRGLVRVELRVVTVHRRAPEVLARGDTVSRFERLDAEPLVAVGDLRQERIPVVVGPAARADLLDVDPVETVADHPPLARAQDLLDEVGRHGAFAGTPRRGPGQAVPRGPRVGCPRGRRRATRSASVTASSDAPPRERFAPCCSRPQQGGGVVIVDAGRVVPIAGDRRHAVSRGIVCVEGSRAIEGRRQTRRRRAGSKRRRASPTRSRRRRPRRSLVVAGAPRGRARALRALGAHRERLHGRRPARLRSDDGRLAAARPAVPPPPKRRTAGAGGFEGGASMATHALTLPGTRSPRRAPSCSRRATCPGTSTIRPRSTGWRSRRSSCGTGSAPGASSNTRNPATIGRSASRASRSSSAATGTGTCSRFRTSAAT